MKEGLEGQQRWPTSLAGILLGVGAVGGTHLALRRFGAGRLSALLHSSGEGPTEGLEADFQEVEIQSTDGFTLEGRWVPKEGSFRSAVLVPGRGGDSSSDYLVRAARIYGGAGFNVLMLSLRSQGASEGEFLTAGYWEVCDIRGALVWLKGRELGAENTIVHGWSTGGVAVLRAAPGAGVGAVVEESAYADLPLLLGELFPGGSAPSGLLSHGASLAGELLGVGFDPWALRPKKSAARLFEEGIPLFVIHSPQDEKVSFKHASLIREAHPRARLWEVGGYGHAGAYRHPTYPERLYSFLEESMAAGSRHS